ncbi:MAG: glycyl-radical enzyme activating protein [Lachnospiraceae bacterium]|nr:glycyl-radical enzyme activating protein [Lachnospiraceae bacterium]MDY5741626.1 glycyl-radical enzyme activating protein [Lachnospiraceae bacterium]
MNTAGRIFDIQRFSIHDGYGIRTVVFFKGCILRCRWCCNPESQSFAKETMLVQGRPKLIGRDVSVAEVMEEVLLDQDYYRRSGGGLTLSGGEILCQAEFAGHLLRAAKASGLHTAVESMGGLDWTKIELILPYLDQYLLDIKHMDAAKHEVFTGRTNELMLANAKRLAAYSGIELSIRIPVIPTFNDTVEEIQAIARFAAGLKTVRRLHLLPYHRLGQDKYEGLGRKYLMAELRPPGAARMAELRAAAEATFGPDVQIGG